MSLSHSCQPGRSLMNRNMSAIRLRSDFAENGG